MAKEDDDALVDIYGDASDTMDPPPIITAKDKLNVRFRSFAVAYLKLISGVM